MTFHHSPYLGPAWPVDPPARFPQDFLLDCWRVLKNALLGGTFQFTFGKHGSTLEIHFILLSAVCWVRKNRHDSDNQQRTHPHIFACPTSCIFCMFCIASKGIDSCCLSEKSPNKTQTSQARPSSFNRHKTQRFKVRGFC